MLGKECDGGAGGRSLKWRWEWTTQKFVTVLRGGSQPFLYRRPTLYLLLLLTPPLLWFGVIYLGSLFTLLWQGAYTFDDFTMTVTPDFTLDNIKALFNPSNYDIIVRTLTMAILVSLACALLAFPIAYYMARYTRGRSKAFFYIAIMMPMWASYIVKVYAWTLLLAKDGVAQWFLHYMGLEPVLAWVLGIPDIGGSTLSTSGLGRFMVFVYIWLPFMILPIQAALERLPPTLLQASADLGRIRRKPSVTLSSRWLFRGLLPVLSSRSH